MFWGGEAKKAISGIQRGKGEMKRRKESGKRWIEYKEKGKRWNKKRKRKSQREKMKQKGKREKGRDRREMKMAIR